MLNNSLQFFKKKMYICKKGKIDMHFESLKEKSEYFRSLTDYKLIPNSYAIIMLDGRSFSRKIKNKFQKPFDGVFMNAMNETAKYLVQNIQGAKFAYTQSDEISIIISDFDTPETDSFFGYRICKIQSLCASMATCKFNQIMAKHEFEKDFRMRESDTGIYTFKDAAEAIDKLPLYEFDCKVWNVPDLNTAIAWLLFRNIDCMRNSRQQFAQTYASHKDLMGKDAMEQVAYAKEHYGKDWDECSDGEKYGRFVVKHTFKENRPLIYKDNDGNIKQGKDVEFIKSTWDVIDGGPLTEPENREAIEGYINGGII